MCSRGAVPARVLQRGTACFTRTCGRDVRCCSRRRQRALEQAASFAGTEIARFRTWRRGERSAACARTARRPPAARCCAMPLPPPAARAGRRRRARALRHPAPKMRAAMKSAASRAPGRSAASARERVQHGSRGVAVAGERAQHVEAHHVARAFPDRVDRRLAIEPRQQALLDVAIAAETLHRLVDETRRGLAHPVFHRRREQPRARRLARIVGREIERARQAA